MTKLVFKNVVLVVFMWMNCVDSWNPSMDLPDVWIPEPPRDHCLQNKAQRTCLDPCKPEFTTFYSYNFYCYHGRGKDDWHWCETCPRIINGIRWNECKWEGTATKCEGACYPGWTEITRSWRGDGHECYTGSKALCCRDKEKACPLQCTNGKNGGMCTEWRNGTGGECGPEETHGKTYDTYDCTYCKTGPPTVKYDEALTTTWCSNHKDVVGRLECDSDEACLHNARSQCDEDPGCLGVAWYQPLKSQPFKMCLSRAMAPKTDGWRTMMKSA